MTEPLLTRSQWAAMMRAPLRDKSYQLTGLGAAVTDFLAWKRVNGAAERTLDQYERDLARGCLLYPERTLETVESADILQVLLLFPAPSRHRARAAWSSFFKWAYLWELIERNPIDRVPQIASEPQRYIETFRDAEVEALISLPLRDGALMAILLDAGLRRSEACNLQLRRCDLERAQLVVIEGKGAKDRVVPMSPRLISLVADLAVTEGLGDETYLWYTVKANKVSSRVLRQRHVGVGSFHRWWARCLTEAGVEYRPRTKTDGGRGNPHAARHTVALRWLRGQVGRSGAPGKPGRMETLQKVLGHESIQTTIDLYGHLDLSDVAADLAGMVADG
jgi:integrase